MKRLHDLENVNSDIEHLWPKPGVRPGEQAPGAIAVASAGQEIERLNASVDELDTALKKADRRIERLIGERSQVRALLDKRDQEIQKLNRELGGHNGGRRLVRGPGGTLPPASRSLSAFVTWVGERMRGAFAGRTKAAETHAVTREPNAAGKGVSQPLIARRQNRSSQQIVIAIMFGLNKEDVERLIPIIERDCASKKMTPLFLTDIDAFEVLRSRDLIFEYLPPAGDRNRFDPSLHWDLYLQRRLALIRKKWDPVRVVAFGALATKALTLWCSSPFEDTPLPATTSEAAVSP